MHSSKLVLPLVLLLALFGGIWLIFDEQAPIETPTALAGNESAEFDNADGWIGPGPGILETAASVEQAPTSIRFRADGLKSKREVLVLRPNGVPCNKKMSQLI